MSMLPHEMTEKEIKEIWERLTAGEQSIKSAHHRIDALQEMSKSVKELAISVSQIAMETKALREDYATADKKIASLESRPIKRYDTIVTAIITALCGGIVGYFLSTILK